MEKIKWVRLSAVLLTFMLLTTLCACGGQPETENLSEATPIEATTTAMQQPIHLATPADKMATAADAPVITTTEMPATSENTAAPTIEQVAPVTTETEITVAGTPTPSAEKKTVSSANARTSVQPKGLSTKTEKEETEEPGEKLACTIAVYCDTILNHMDELDEDKQEIVPKNGVILKVTEAEFEEGDTVFDVLKKICKKKKIHLEYSWTPIYESYYIEGIANLYERDAGDESGWMYSVNGWFPNYGCSSYELEDGDDIEWCYTCDLGSDVGGGWLAE